MALPLLKRPYNTEQEALGKLATSFRRNRMPANPTDGVIECLDVFAGCGGFSQALNRLAEKHGWRVRHTILNHWDVALENAKFNLGDVRVFNSSIEDVHPSEVMPNGHVDIMLASPECIYFSSARGAREINDQRRSTFAEILKFLELLHVDVLVLENVQEARNWGPLDGKKRPIKAQRGIFFQGFLKALARLGYDVAYETLCAADYGDATTRKRLFLVARRRGNATLPQKSHSKGGAIAGTLPWIPAREVIDFCLKGLSIFDRDEPHVPKTLNRVEIGYEDQLATSPLAPAYVEAVSRFKGLSQRYHDFVTALPTKKKLGRKLTKDEHRFVRQAKRQAQAQHRMLLEEIFLEPVAFYDWADLLRGGPVDAALTEDGKHVAIGTLNIPMALFPELDAERPVQPEEFLVTVNHGDKGNAASRVLALDETLSGDITSKGSQGVVQSVTLPSPTILPQHTFNDARTSSIDQPVPPATTICRHAVVQSDAQPFVTAYYGTTRHSRTVGEPLRTQPTENHLALVQNEATLAAIADKLVAAADVDGLVALYYAAIPAVTPAIVNLKGQSTATSSNEPTPTQTAHAPHLYLTEGTFSAPEPVIISRNNEADGGPRRPHRVSEPTPTATGSGAGYLNQSEITSVSEIGDTAAIERATPEPVVIPQQRGAGVEFDRMSRPLRALQTRNGNGIAIPYAALQRTSRCKPYVIVGDTHIIELDVLYRMLEPKELMGAMSIATKQHRYEFVKGTSKSAQVKMIGNAVAVHNAMAVIECAMYDRIPEAIAA